MHKAISDDNEHLHGGTWTHNYKTISQVIQQCSYQPPLVYILRYINLTTSPLLLALYPWVYTAVYILQSYTCWRSFPL